MPYVKSPLSTRPIDSYLLRTRCDPSATISIVDSDTDDDVTPLQSSQQSAESNSSSVSPPCFPSPSSSYPTQRATAAIRRKRDRLAALTGSALSPATSSAANADIARTPRPQCIDSFLPRTSSLPLSVNSSDNDNVPSSSHSAPVSRVTLSVITNVVESPAMVKSRFNNAKQRAFYQLVRNQLGHVNDGEMCRYCGERKHTTIHHEADFRRNGNIRPPSVMRPKALRAEVLRCTREDGTIGLASLCNQCHFEAERQLRDPFLEKRSRHERNIKADVAAKLARGKCQCDSDCGVSVTRENLEEFEWDHLVQKPDDPSYRYMSRLVSGASLKRCEVERAKCRLLYSLCHKAHSQMQCRQRRRSKTT